MRKTVDEATSILETMAFDSCLWPTERAIAPKAAGKIEVDSVTALQAQISALSKQLGNLSHKANAAPINFQGEQCHMMGNIGDEFVFYNAGNFRDDGVEQANYVGNQFQGRQANNPYSNTYNPEWPTHPNFL